MLSANTWDKVADQIDESDFYREKSSPDSFRAIADLCQSGQPCDCGHRGRLVCQPETSSTGSMAVPI